MTAAMRLPHPDWLRHDLTVSGAPCDIEAFRAAASGPGRIPWPLDGEPVEEDWFHRLLAAGALSQHGAAVLARQLRDAVTERHRWVTDRSPANRSCPFDLHALVPVPDEVLALGPDSPVATEWLWQHWGTTEALRRVTLAAEPAGSLQIGFWAADWTPWRALAQIGAEWPGLHLSVRPQYERHGRS